MAGLSTSSSSSRSSFKEEGPQQTSVSKEGQTEFQKENPKGRITWTGKVKEPHGLGESDNSGGEPKMDWSGDQGRRAGNSGGFSKSGLAPLTPLAPAQGETRATAEDREAVQDRRAYPTGHAYSSPNLKGLNNVSDAERQRLMEFLQSGAANQAKTGYVDPVYEQLLPSRGNTRNGPVWSLNQPLPHVLDQSLADKVVRKSMDVRSRASSKANSTSVSRTGSGTSINDWKRLVRRAGSKKKLNDVEAQLPSAAPSQASLRSRQRRDQALRTDGHAKRHNARFSLESDSSSSMRDEEPSGFEKAQSRHSKSRHDSAKSTSRTQRVDSDYKDGAQTDDVIGKAASKITHEKPDEMSFPNYWAKIRYHMREPFAEFLGTLILVIFGVGGNLQATVTNGSGGSFESLSFAWGFGCMLGVYVAGGVSGGHVNPAVTISMAIFRQFPWKKVPVYIVAQIVGAFFGGAMAYGYFWSSITEFEGGAHIRTAVSGACLFTNPKPYVTWRNAFFDEFIGSSILVGCLMAILDDNNAPPANGMAALIVGLLVAAIGMALGYQTSFTINPARDLGPRIFASMIGYGPHAFHLTHWWWTWGAWGGPIAGGIAGALVYDIFIFTGYESPVNYPDNGYIEDRVDKILHRDFIHHSEDSAETTENSAEDNSNGKDVSPKSDSA